jgi:hypothetical protein
MTSKYDTLRSYLEGKPRGEFTRAFAEIERILGFVLPGSASQPQWWSNVSGDGHPHSRAWQAAGFKAFLFSGSRKVRFSSQAQG